MTRENLRIGVAGAGVFGALHAAKLAANPAVTLAGIYDRDRARAQALASRFGAEAFTDFPQFLERLDGLSIATAASAHAEQAFAALSLGKAVYVEKPLATTRADGAALLEVAHRTGAVLACGHQERLVLRELGLLNAGAARPHRVTAWRLGPPSGRGQDVSVFLDLMVHDADLALALINAPAQRVDGMIEAYRNGQIDAGQAQIRFAGGAQASLSASRVAAVKDRRLVLEYASGQVSIDFVTGCVRDEAGLGLPDMLPKGDPLAASLAAFVSSAPAVSGQEGLAALELVLAAEAAA